MSQGQPFRPRLLLYLSHSGDLHRFAVGPVLAAAAARAGWGFECYYDRLRRGRHWGGGAPDEAKPGWSGGSLVAGGRHADQLLWLTTGYEVVAVGDPACLLWPALAAMGVEALEATSDPAELYRLVFGLLDLPLPTEVIVLDGRRQGEHQVVVSPYLYPRLLGGPPVVAIDVSGGGRLRQEMERLGTSKFHGLYVEQERADAFSGGLDSREGDAGTSTYATLTANLAHAHRDWGRGIILGDPDLVGAQLPKARRLRLLPLYGSPQTVVIAEAELLVEAATEPVFGRQYDDRDFFALSRLGHGLQILDPDPPFDSAAMLAPVACRRLPAASPAHNRPSTAQLSAWADEGRVLSTLLFWCGMVREVDVIGRLVDLVATTDLRAGLVVTTESVEHATGATLALLGTPVERGGVGGRIELLLASTGRGVAPEALLPPGALARHLVEARTAMAARLPAHLVPLGWWPLLDTTVVEARPPLMVWERGGPRIRVPTRPATAGRAAPGRRPGQWPDLRSLAGWASRRSGLDRFVEERRPYDHVRPGPFEPEVATAVRQAGFAYMWTKAAFGTGAVAWRQGDFVALPFTAGNWDGWTPFYTVGHRGDVERAERRLLRSGRPGWLATTVDATLFAMSGEVLEHGSTLYRAAEQTARGGRSGRLINVTPGVVARYARLLDDRRRKAGAGRPTVTPR